MSEFVAIASIAVLFVAYALLQRRQGTPSGGCHRTEDEECASCTQRTDCTELNDARV